MSEQFGRGISGDQVGLLVEEKLRPLGVLARADGSSPPLQRVDPLLALRLRAAVVPPAVVRAIAALFAPLFFPLVVVAVIGALVALDVWLFALHGVAQSARELAYNPALLLGVLGLVALSAAFHECGHAAACRYGGAQPGAMGVGIYVVWPAFYTDVTDAYRLGRLGRLRTDLGGIYFNAIFSLGTYAAYFATGFEPLLAVVVLQHLEMVHQLLPFLRLDGYYIVSDLTGVPDMFARIRPVLRSLLPWRKADERVRELKPWARVVVTVYVLALIPVIGFVLGSMVMSLPRLLATVWDSLFVQLDRAGDAFAAGDAVAGLAGGVQLAALMLPVAGISLTTGRAGKRVLARGWSATAGSPALRGVFALAAAAVGAAAAFVLLPNGDYVPIQPGERGTVQGAVQAFSAIPTGRPALTEEHERKLGEVVIEREERDRREPASDDEDPAREPVTPTTGETGTTETEPTSTDTTPAETTETATTATETTATDTTRTETTPTDTTTDTTPTTTISE